MIIFSGTQFAQNREAALKVKVQNLVAHGHQPRIAAILFDEDKGSQLYTRKKKEAAARVGIKYDDYHFSFTDDVTKVIAKIKSLNVDQEITGIIIQKPAKAVWESVTGKTDFADWWHALVLEINPHKDVDGLHPQTLEHIKTGDWEKAGCVMPATAKAVLLILEEAWHTVSTHKIIILGKSDILGQPLYYELKNHQHDVEMIGSAQLKQRQEQGIGLTDADAIISATGRPNLITGDLVKEGVIVVDVGEPQPDVDESVKNKAAFLTPVPGGVGPVTIISLLENSLELA